MVTKREELELLAKGEGCLAKAADDEPVFILRAQDAFAPLAIVDWANNLRAVASVKQDKVLAKKYEDKALGALEVSAQMVIWQKANGKKIPD